MNVHAFPDLKLLDAKTALDRLKDYARKLQPFGPTVDFDDPIWDLTAIKRSRPTEAQTHRLFFTRIARRETRSMEGRIAFGPAFGNLIKTIVALREFTRPSGPALYRKLLQASRHLYEALEDHDFDPVRLTSEHFDLAAEAVKGTSPDNRYQIGNNLEEIAGFINKHALAKARIDFNSPFERQRYATRADDASRAKRASKMPSEELIDAVIAMSDVVRKLGDDREILRAAIVELLMCAPWRINDLLSLLANCTRRETVTDPKTGGQVNALGFAHSGSKGADDPIKWIPTPMKEVAERAIADILRITQPGRNIALWMEEHPGRAFVAEPFRLAEPSTKLTMTDVAHALGLNSKEASTYWLKAKKVPVAKRDGRFWCTLADLEVAVLRLQPKLPEARRLSEYLLLVPDHYFRDDMGDVPTIISFVTDAQVHGFLSTTGLHKSVFERLGITDVEGDPYVVTSHAFRHYLNTIAKDGELPELDIARWSGRKRIEQNAAYDHTGGRQLAKRMREIHDTAAMRGPMTETIQRLPPAERDAFLKARINTAHMTDIGACIQDWSLSPCPNHGWCAGCGDHLVIKGNETHKARAERLLMEHETILTLAKNEMDDGTYGASDWVSHNEKMVEGLRRTVAVHADPTITDGTVVQV